MNYVLKFSYTIKGMHILNNNKNVFENGKTVFFSFDYELHL